MPFSKRFVVSRVSYDSAGKTSLLVEVPESKLLQSVIEHPCSITLHTDKESEFDFTPLEALFEVSFKRVWPMEKE